MAEMGSKIKIINLHKFLLVILGQSAHYKFDTTGHIPWQAFLMNRVSY